MPAALKVDDLTTEIQLSRSVVHAVGNVALGIDSHETVGLVGESGMRQVDARALDPRPAAATGGHITGGSIKLDEQELVGMTEDAAAPDPRQRRWR